MTATDTPRQWETQVQDFLDGEVSAEARERGVLTLADLLSATTVGAEVEGVADVRTGLDLGEGAATVIGVGDRVEPGYAALLNTAACVAPETEEGHNLGGHVGAATAAGGLALAERADLDGRSFVEAFVRAYEVAARVEHGVSRMLDRINEGSGWELKAPHVPATVLGPALCGALCLDAAADRRRDVTRIAANLLVVTMRDPFTSGPSARNVYPGYLAQTGVTVARTGVAGVGASEEMVTGAYDPVRDLFDGDGFDDLFADLGDTWEITNNYFKPYPSCRYTHPALSALRDALAGIDSVSPADVDSIEVATFGQACTLDDHRPDTFTGAKFSIPYVLARYVADGTVRFDHFEEDAIADPAVRDLGDRVSITREESFEAAFPDRWGARATVTLTDGRTLTGETPHAPWSQFDPVDRESLRAAFRDRAARTLGDDRAEDAVAAALDLPDRQVRDVTAAFCP